MNQRSVVETLIVVAAVVFVGAIAYFAMTNGGGEPVLPEVATQSKSITIDTSDWQLFNAGQKGDSTFILPNFKFPINWQTINISGGQRVEFVFSDSNQKNIAEETDNECRFSVLYDGNDNSKKISKRNSKNTAVLKNECGLIIEEMEKQIIQVSENVPTQASSLTKLKELGIEVDFSEGYDIAKSEGKTIIRFGPLSAADFGPNPAQEINPYHIYNLYTVPKLTSAEIIAEIKKNNPSEELITVKPEVKNINNLIVVKWAEGGMCENRIMEVVGPKNNYRFSSLGCHQDQKFDFDYFEKTIKTIKFL